MLECFVFVCIVLVTIIVVTRYNLEKARKLKNSLLHLRNTLLCNLSFKEFVITSQIALKCLKKDVKHSKEICQKIDCLDNALVQALCLYANNNAPHITDFSRTIIKNNLQELICEHDHTSELYAIVDRLCSLLASIALEQFTNFRWYCSIDVMLASESISDVIKLIENKNRI